VRVTYLHKPPIFAKEIIWGLYARQRRMAMRLCLAGRKQRPYHVCAWYADGGTAVPPSAYVIDNIWSYAHYRASLLCLLNSWPCNAGLEDAIELRYEQIRNPHVSASEKAPESHIPPPHRHCMPASTSVGCERCANYHISTVPHPTNTSSGLRFLIWRLSTCTKRMYFLLRTRRNRARASANRDN